jgi:hypothetical protein
VNKEKVNEEPVLEIILSGFVVIQDNDESTRKNKDVRIHEHGEEEDVRIQEEHGRIQE